jgi:hypothetical protein
MNMDNNDQIETVSLNDMDTAFGDWNEERSSYSRHH